jgi:hypothetical protein
VATSSRAPAGRTNTSCLQQRIAFGANNWLPFHTCKETTSAPSQKIPDPPELDAELRIFDAVFMRAASPRFVTLTARHSLGSNFTAWSVKESPTSLHFFSSRAQQHLEDLHQHLALSPPRNTPFEHDSPLGLNYKMHAPPYLPMLHHRSPPCAKRALHALSLGSPMQAADACRRRHCGTGVVYCSCM